MPDRMPEYLPDNIPKDVSARMPEDMPEHIPEDMPDKIPENILDDGWPESVEEGLFLLVWRHNFTHNIFKMCYRQSRRGVSRRNSEKCKTIVASQTL